MKKPRKKEDIEFYRHETDKRKNAVPVGLASYDTAKPKPKKYEYAPHFQLKHQFSTALQVLMRRSNFENN